MPELLQSNETLFMINMTSKSIAKINFQKGLAMKKQLLILSSAIFFSLFYSIFAFSQTPTPVGFWRTYDDEGTARSIAQMYIVNGQLQGKIVKMLAPARGETLQPTCTECKGEFKDKPLKNLVFIWGLTKNGDTWENGQVLDFDNGKIYQCQITVSPDNKILHILGYAGAPLFGKTIDWQRVK